MIYDGMAADPKQQPGLVAKEKTPYLQYRDDKNEYQNLRIGQMLEPRKTNDALQKYLEQRSSYETASFGETTSADEIVL